MRACEWRYKTRRVPTHSVPLNPSTQARVCEELAEYVEDFLELMMDEPRTKNRPTRLLERDASKNEAVEWLKEFEEYFENKETDLLKRGYQPFEHGRMISNAYIDQNLEHKLNHDEPPGAGLPV